MRIGYLGDSSLENSSLENSPLENGILKDIQKSVFYYLEGNNENLPKDIKKTISSLKDNLGEGKINLKDIKIEQFVIRYLGEKHRQVNFVLTIGNITKSVSIVINNKNEEVINLTISNKYSKVLEKELDNRNDQNVLVRTNNRKNAKKDPLKEGINIDEKSPEETEEDFSKRIFEEIVMNTWNEIFLKNIKDLKESENRKNLEEGKSKKDIIEKNAKAIENLFTGILQGTVDYTHSTYEDITDYFIHFLEKTPKLAEKPKISNIKQVEDGVVIANGAYEFELDNGEGERFVLPANFTFVFTKGANGNWTIAGLHSYTD